MSIFVPLAREPFEKFASGRKTVEVRNVDTPVAAQVRKAVEGATVRLRLGYSGGRELSGTLGRTWEGWLDHLTIPDWAVDGAAIDWLDTGRFFDRTRKLLAFEVRGIDRGGAPSRIAERRREPQLDATSRVAALFVAEDGPYIGLPNVDAWTKARDARLYVGPHPVVAHPPCGPHGTFAKAGRCSTDDEGTGAAAAAAVRQWGGVLEQPARSRLFRAQGLPLPPMTGWGEPDAYGGRSCRVDQAAYGHRAQKATWLYAKLPAFPELDWRRTPGQALIGRRDHYSTTRARAEAKANGTYVSVPEVSRRERYLTPEPFKALLLGMAASCTLRDDLGRPATSLPAGRDAAVALDVATLP